MARFEAKTPLLRRLWQGRFQEAVLPRFRRHKNLKNGSIGPFQSRCTLIHTPRTRWLCPGCLLRKPPVRTIDAQSVGRFRFGSAFETASQRFNAGWSSPVARQAHNLKVIGSNPIPATKPSKKPPFPGGFFVSPSHHRRRDLLRRHQHRKIGVGARHHGEDRGVDDAQALDAFDAALVVDHRHRIVGPAHAA
jgi:hypothetical protein